MAKHYDSRDSYVYVLLDTRKPGEYVYGNYTFKYLPFYVGKGCGNRRHHHTDPNSWKYNPFKGRVIKKILDTTGKPPKIKIKYCANEEAALAKEIHLIKTIGRYNVKEGPLTNLTDGGEGVSGKIWSYHERKLQSLRQRNRWKNTSKEDRDKFSNNLKKVSRRTHEDYLKDVHEYNPNIVVLTKFISYTETKNVNITQACGCPKTIGSRIITAKKLEPCYLHSLKKAAKLQGLIVLDKPLKSRDYSNFECVESSHIFTRMSGKILYKELTGCPKCSALNRRIHTESFVKEIMNDTRSIKELMEIYGLRRETISMMRNGRYNTYRAG